MELKFRPCLEPRHPAGLELTMDPTRPVMNRAAELISVGRSALRTRPGWILRFLSGPPTPAWSPTKNSSNKLWSNISHQDNRVGGVHDAGGATT